jgi:CheY-like chemotaxis protein
LSPKKILIVDDEPDITLTLGNGLEQGGYDVHVFNDPLVALSNFKPDTYDLLLLDIKMPNMTGFELYHFAAAINDAFSSFSDNPFSTFSMDSNASRYPSFIRFSIVMWE